MNYFYARVSTAKQNADRQLDAAQRAGFSETCTFVDYESGKDFNRTNWTLLQERLTSGDALFVKSIDRLGRNYKEILRVWQELTKDRGIDVVVLDMPLLDTRREKNLLGTFIADLVLQVLSFVAENERVNIKERQREGIAAAKERGVKFGRPRRELPPNFDEVFAQYRAKRLSGCEAARQLNLSVSTFRNVARRFGVVSNQRLTPDDVRPIADRWFSGEITEEKAAEGLGVTCKTFAALARRAFPGRLTLRQIQTNERREAQARACEEREREIQRRIQELNKAAKAKRDALELFLSLARRYIDGEITSREAADELGTTPANFCQRVNRNLEEINERTQRI